MRQVEEVRVDEGHHRHRDVSRLAMPECASSTANRTYYKEFGAAMLAYVALLFISIVALDHVTSLVWRVPIALVPMVPAFFVLVAFVRFLGRVDEMQRLIHLEALAFAFGGTALLTFSYGFLQNAGFPSLSWFCVWPLMAVLWVIGQAWATRRYR